MPAIVFSSCKGTGTALLLHLTVTLTSPHIDFQAYPDATHWHKRACAQVIGAAASHRSYIAYGLTLHLQNIRNVRHWLPKFHLGHTTILAGGAIRVPVPCTRPPCAPIPSSPPLLSQHHPISFLLPLKSLLQPCASYLHTCLNSSLISSLGMYSSGLSVVEASQSCWNASSNVPSATAGAMPWRSALEKR